MQVIHTKTLNIAFGGNKKRSEISLHYDLTESNVI